MDHEYWTPKLQDLLQPGKVVKQDFGPRNHGTMKLHILAIVDDDYIVVKHWGNHKKRWFYEVKSIYWFEIIDRGGHLKKARP